VSVVSIGLWGESDLTVFWVCLVLVWLLVTEYRTLRENLTINSVLNSLCLSVWGLESIGLWGESGVLISDSFCLFLLVWLWESIGLWGESDCQ
jgi:hypothetical protein